MLTRIGKAAAAPEDVVGLLLDCHERIRSFLALAGRIVEASPSDGDAVRDAAARVHRYFTEALPLHARDEDESIVPRLRGRDPEVDAALATMSAEHREHERPLAALVAACAALAAEPARLPELSAPLARAVEDLEQHFLGHLAREEEVVFPALRLLRQNEQDAIVRELRARRQRP